MWQDPIVSEIHQTRDKISQAYGDDMHAIFAAAQRGELAKPVIATTPDALAQPDEAHNSFVTAAP